MTKKGGKAFVAGVGMTKFEKPGRREWDHPDMVRESAGKALEDAGVAYADVEHVCAGWVYGDSTAGQRAVYELGLRRVPIINVNNNCSTGSSSLYAKIAEKSHRHSVNDPYGGRWVVNPPAVVSLYRRAA